MSGSATPPLPPGFTMDEAQATQQQPPLPPGFTVDAAPGHAVAGPSGSFWTDIPRRIGTAVVDAATGMMSPILRNSPGAIGVNYDQNGKPSISQPQPHMTEADKQAAYNTGRDNAYNTAGVTEYQPSTEGGRIGQAALTGLVGGLMTGGGAIPSAVGSAAG